MYPIHFGCSIWIDNATFSSLIGDEILEVCKTDLRHDIFEKIRTLGLTPLREVTFAVTSEPFFTHNATAVLARSYAVAIPIPW